jgi:hypothetical protein
VNYSLFPDKCSKYSCRVLITNRFLGTLRCFAGTLKDWAEKYIRVGGDLERNVVLEDDQVYFFPLNNYHQNFQKNFLRSTFPKC